MISDDVVLMVVVKLPRISSTSLSSKLSKGTGHNYYGEPGWPNDILYIFPPVIFGICSCVFGLAVAEPLGMGTKANPFATPVEILPEWYLFPTFNLLRVLADKFIGILSLLALAVLLLLLPLGENLSIYQNPMRRPLIGCIFLTALGDSLWLRVDI
jgi:cytochrome b6-f complex subunit 4